MKRTFFVLLLTGCLGLSLKSQDNDWKKEIKHGLQFDLGGHYNYKFGKKYYPPEPRNYNNLLFGGHSLLFSPGFQTGLLYKVSYKRLYCEIGLQYFMRDSRIICNKDSVLKYTPSSMLDKSMLENKLRRNNLEMPIRIGFEIKRFIIETGLSIVILSKLSGYTILYNGTKYRSNASLEWFKGSQTIYPSFRLGYKFNQRKIPLYIYSGFDYRSRNKYFDFNLGLYLTIL